MTDQGRTELTLFSSAFRDFVRRQDMALEAWAAKEQGAIRASAKALNRSLGQDFRHLRVRLVAALPAWPEQTDSDYFLIVRAKAHLQHGTEAVDAMERRLRLFADQPLTLKEQTA